MHPKVSTAFWKARLGMRFTVHAENYLSPPTYVLQLFQLRGPKQAVRWVVLLH